MLEQIFGKEVSDYIIKTSIVGLFLGILSIALSSEKTCYKQKLTDTIYAVLFAVITGFGMKHFEIATDTTSPWLEWAIIGLVSFNQNPIRCVVHSIFADMINKPFDTLKKLKELIKK
jgi:hypothetical protein